MIAFLHTSEIHINKFETLVRKFNSNIDIKHFVNENILDYALEKGMTDSKSFENEVLKIKALNPELIICTCSTYGEECDKSDDIERIDQPIANYLVKNYKNIGLAYTANSTKIVSKNLLLHVAGEKEINIIECDCSSSWKYYEANDFNMYARSIAATIKKMEHEVDVIFLAQASMEGCKEFLMDFSKDIHSSPEFGVKEYLTK